VIPVWGFYPRLREGGDERALTREREMGRVSTHASAREATLPLPLDEPTTIRFYPRLREGGD